MAFSKDWPQASTELRKQLELIDSSTLAVIAGLENGSDERVAKVFAQLGQGRLLDVQGELSKLSLLAQQLDQDAFQTARAEYGQAVLSVASKDSNLVRAKFIASICALGDAAFTRVVDMVQKEVGGDNLNFFSFKRS